MEYNLNKNADKNLFLCIVFFVEFTANTVNVYGKIGYIGSSLSVNTKCSTQNYTSLLEQEVNVQSLVSLRNSGVDDPRYNRRKVFSRSSISDKAELTRSGYQNENMEPKKSPFAVVIMTIFHMKYEKLKKAIEEREYTVGALIHERWVLTSASRLVPEPGKKRGKATVYAGNTTVVEYERVADQAREVEEIFIHPKYQGPSKKNLDARYDFALVKLKHAFIMTSTVSFVEMSRKRWPYKGYRACKVTGFGKVFTGYASKDDDARKTHSLNLIRLNDSNCPNPNPENPYLITELRDGFGLCQADYGAPLVCEGQVRGVFSNIYSKSELDNCFNGAVNSTTYECGSSKTYTMFQDTCACLSFVNQRVKLFLKDDIEDCIKVKKEKPPLVSGGLLKRSQPIHLLIPVMMFRRIVMSCLV